MSFLYVFVCIFLLVFALMLSNVGLVNNIYFPITTSIPIFPIMFEQNAWETLYIFSNKSLVAIGQADQASGLYLWTLELDLISLLSYFIIAAVGVKIIHAMSHIENTNSRIYAWTMIALILAILSRTYITVLAHCAGPTWIGYVVLYGLGVEELELSNKWQWISFAFACLLLLIPIRKIVSNKSTNYF